MRRKAVVALIALVAWVAGEAFVSSTVREVQPIASVDGIALPAAPGPITERLAVAFTELTQRDLDP